MRSWGARRALGLSQEELAWRLYVSRVAVSHWETSRTRPTSRACSFSRTSLAPRSTSW
ncbi:MAG TPA: helix-turn-helix domain-containing protein [Candidatus Olsenella stercoravium]|uniref:Helix-turn-helix domain-containing protein n=1 Tax=Candidatus Olsenella stercoravium TaxID=2838713 RepID=A0A9D2IPG6_9ACTN|nr:helix-turn-helix domain-containing protein [Candidatus Olsenella stercoravium]